jgi:hypothetical protein
MEQTLNIMSKNYSAYLFAAFALVFAKPSFVHSQELVTNPVSMKIVMNDESKIVLRICNTGDQSYAFNSNIKMILSDTFLNFPRSAYLQFSPNNMWQSIASFSSQANPPGLDYTRTEVIMLKSKESMDFPIDYKGAIGMASNGIEQGGAPKRFRIKIPIGILNKIKIVDVDIVSDWFSAENTKQ